MIMDMDEIFEEIMEIIGVHGHYMLPLDADSLMFHLSAYDLIYEPDRKIYNYVVVPHNSEIPSYRSLIDILNDILFDGNRINRVIENVSFYGSNLNFPTRLLDLRDSEDQTYFKDVVLFTVIAKMTL